MARKVILHYLRRLLALEDPPERIALAFATGVFIAFSPLLGLHAILGIVIAFLFGLNRMAVLLGVFVNNPWTLVPIYVAAAYVGGAVVGYPAGAPLPAFGWRQLWDAQYWWEIARLWRHLIPVVLGSFILSVFSAIVSYPLALLLLKQRRACRTSSDSAARP